VNSGGWEIPALYESEVFKTLADIVPFLVADLETRTIVYTSRWVEQIFGYLRNGLVGKDVHELIPPEYRDAHGRHWDGFRRNPAARVMRPASLPALRRDGTTFPVKVLLYPTAMRVSHGSPVPAGGQA
jgi:PAS domain S-box-containing protein